MSLSRRRLLAALGAGMSSSFLSPMTGQLIGQARAGAVPPLRLVVFAFGNGLLKEHYQTTVRSETDWDLPDVLSPLAAYKSRLTIAGPLYHPHGRQLHGNGSHTLTVAKPLGIDTSFLGGGEFGGPSLDRVVAHQIGSGDAFSSLYAAAYHFQTFPQLSADGANTAYPYEWNPIRLYETIFGPKDPDTSEPAAQRLARDRSVLDFLSTRIQRVGGLLAGEEKFKMDQYLESVRALEKQLAAVQSARQLCARPTPPTCNGDNGEGGNDADFMHGPVIVPETMNGLVDVTTNALICNMTKVGLIQLHADAPYADAHFLRDDLQSHHAQHANDDPGIRMLETHFMGYVARLLDALSAIKEGNGSMADNTVVVVVNTGGGAHHGGSDLHPLIVIGDAGGKLNTGRYLQLTEKDYCIADGFTAIVNAFGIETQTFGDEKYCRGPLPGMLA